MKDLLDLDDVPSEATAELAPEVAADIEALAAELTVDVDDKLPLQDYPAAIERVGLALMQARSLADEADDEVEKLTVQRRLTLDYQELGRNEQIRESRIKAMLWADSSYLGATTEAKMARRKVGQLTLQKERLENEFNAARIRRREQVVIAEMRARI